MKPIDSASDGRRVLTQSRIVFLASIAAAALAVFVGFLVLLASCVKSVNEINLELAHLGQAQSTVRPVPIPTSACPALKLVSVAAAEAQTPWLNGSFNNWHRFSRALATPLASLDGALGAAIPHVPERVARDLRETRHEVEVGRLQLKLSYSRDQYLARTNVIVGYSTLRHASALVGDACGFDLAPALQ